MKKYSPKTSCFFKSNIAFLAGVFAAVLFLCIPCFASDYSLKEAHFLTDPAKGTVIAKWYQVSNREEDVTKYKIKLYLNYTEIVLDWKLISNNQMDVSKVIERCGKGRYIFYVYPANGDEDSQKIRSDELTVDSTLLNKIKQTLEKRRNQEDEDYINGIASDGSYLPSGWIELPDGNYQYRNTDHRLVYSCFKDIDGSTYYFTTDGQTVTGWQLINQNWYCFDSEGRLYKNTVTPDGYSVNEQGQLTEDGVVTTVAEPISNSKSINAETLQLIDSVYLYTSERADQVGDVYRLNFYNPSYGTITNLSYSKDYKDWTPGDVITISMNIHAYAGCAFNKQAVVKSSSKKVKLLDLKVTSREISCTFQYIPGKQLTPVTNVSVTSEYVLDWDDVPDAYYYSVNVSDGGSLYYTEKVYDSYFDFSDYASAEHVVITITAYPYNAKLRNMKSSSKYTWRMIDQDYLYDQMIPGQLRLTEDGKIYYIDEFGQRIKDQTLRFGDNFYTFDEQGFARQSCWFEDPNGDKFYYDEHGRMTLGDLTMDGTKYHFNAGESFEKPIGALLKTSKAKGSYGATSSDSDSDDDDDDDDNDD